MRNLEETKRLQGLYPSLSDSEIPAAQVTLEQYFALAWEIYEESILKKRAVDSLARTFYDASTKVDSTPLTK